jgi:hypothetical protein
MLPVTRTGARSVFTSLYLVGFGGGGFGRVFQDVTGTGTNGGESLYPSSTTITYNNYIVAGATIQSWIFAVAPATARWTSIGISIPDISGVVTTGTCFLDGKQAATVSNSGAGGGLGSNVATNLTWGNRTTSGDRNLDGMLSVTHIFDTELSAKDQRMLDANPNCVWCVPDVRRSVVVSIYRPSSDVTTTGWTGTPDNVTLFTNIDETTASGTGYITSPSISGGEFAIFGLSGSLAAGTWDVRYWADFVGSSAQVRITLLDGSNVSQGASGWQTVTSTVANYTATVTTTGAATRVKIEVQ